MAIGVVLNISFVIVEAVFGVISGSFALIADAGHNASDVLGLLLAWGADYLARRPPTRKYTWGLRRSTIYAAFLNAVLLLVACGGILWEAWHRFAEPQAVAGPTMIIVALIGVVINTLTALLFVRGHHDANIRGAFLHMAADAAISLGVVIAGMAILFTGLAWIDPVVSILITLVIVVGTWGCFVRVSTSRSMRCRGASISTRWRRRWAGCRVWWMCTICMSGARARRSRRSRRIWWWRRRWITSRCLRRPRACCGKRFGSRTRRCRWKRRTGFSLSLFHDRLKPVLLLRAEACPT